MARIQVNFANHTATVVQDTVRDSGQASLLDALVAAVDQAGYGASLIEDIDQALQQREHQELLQYRKRVINSVIALGLAIPMMLYGFVFEMGVDSDAQRLSWAVVGILTLAVMVKAGGHFFTGAWKNCRNHNANMDTLIALGTGSAWLYSMTVVLVPQWLPVEARGLYFEAAAVIIGLINLGQSFELKARGRTSQAVKRLLDLRVKTARRVVYDGGSSTEIGTETDVPIEQLVAADLIRARPGEQIAVDGEVVEGNSTVDESMLTGEPVPVVKSLGDEVSAGTLNRSGTLLYRATRVGADTALARVIALVQSAQNSKPPISRLADQVAAIFVPSVLIITVLTALAWFNFGPEPQVVYMLVTASAVLIIACPCALGLATPISVMISVGKAAEYGILIRSGDALQQASQLDTVILDKTGTITQGRPCVTDFQCFNSFTADQVLPIARLIELRSEHPLAEAVVTFSNDEINTQGILPSAEDLSEQGFVAHVGMGVEATINERVVLLGNLRLLSSQKVDIQIDTTVAQTQVAAWQRSACTVIYVAIDGQLAACFAISDPIKDDALAAIQRLHEAGLQVMMLTGDNQATAAAVAEVAGVDDYQAELMPEDKLAYIRKLQQQGQRVGMVGDGINDAPALSQADVVFAIGTGTDVAIESADVTLMRGSLHGVADAIDLSGATLSNIKQNLWAHFCITAWVFPLPQG